MVAQRTIIPGSYGPRTAVFATIYGVAKTGKSVDLGKCVAGGKILTPAPGNLDGLWGAAGTRAEEIYCPTFTAARDIIRKLPKKKNGTGILGLDDASVMAERGRSAAEKTANDGLAVFKQAASELAQLREAAMESGYTIISVFHPMEPGIAFKKKGDSSPVKSYVGGPAVASKPMMPVWAAISYFLLRAVPDSSVSSPLWPVRYRVDPMELNQWLTGDRSSVCAQSNPPNIREIIRRAVEVGHKLGIPSRPIGLEWLDDAAEFVATYRAQGANIVSCAQALGQSANAGTDPRHLRWALQDGCARFELRNSASSWDYLFKNQQAAP